MEACFLRESNFLLQRCKDKIYTWSDYYFERSRCLSDERSMAFGLVIILVGLVHFYFIFFIFKYCYFRNWMKMYAEIHLRRSTCGSRCFTAAEDHTAITAVSNWTIKEQKHNTNAACSVLISAAVDRCLGQDFTCPCKSMFHVDYMKHGSVRTCFSGSGWWWCYHDVGDISVGVSRLWPLSANLGAPSGLLKLTSTRSEARKLILFI